MNTLSKAQILKAAVSIAIVSYSAIFAQAQTAPVQTPALKPTEDKALVTFIITDYDSIPESNAALTITSSDGSFKNAMISDIDGKCEMLMPEGKQYRMSVAKFGVVFNFDDLLAIPKEPGAILFDQSLKIRIVKKYTRVYALDHVYFDTNKWDLKKEMDPALNILLKTMQTHPTMKVEIAGHTDDVGDEESNRRLSQRRADIVVQFLVSHGISDQRLISKGYGEKKPIATNATAEGRAKNRRTEVRVIQE
ncbi:MAG: OmpA family protein [Cytophagales bacterium]|nr:OmpA family protein [Cytophaga sp.]